MKVSRASLLSILSLLKHAVAKSDSTPVYQNVAFSDGCAWSFNGEFGVLVRGIPGLSCLVPSDKLLAAVSKFSADELEIVAGESSVTVCQGRSKIQILASDPRIFPKIFPDKYSPLCRAQNFLGCIKKALMLRDKDDDMFPQIGISRHYVYTTDGKRAARLKLDQPVESDDVTISVDAAKTLCNIGQPTAVFSSDSQLIANVQGVVFVCLKTRSRVPFRNIDAFCSEAPDLSKSKALPADFGLALERVSLMSEGDGGVVLESTGSDLLLYSKRSGSGTAEEGFDWPFHPFNIRINPSHVIDAMKQGLQLVDWSSVLSPDPRMMRFSLPDIDYFVPLMEQ